MLKISVIIPFYNVEEYLDKCLNSVRSQTFKDIEIICVDDCSTDNSYKIAKLHAIDDHRIKIIRHRKNLGLGGARNTGIHCAKGEYIASVDSDDYILPNMLEVLWKEAENSRFDIVCCGFEKVDLSANVLAKSSFADEVIVNTNNSINIFSKINPAFWNKLWRRSLFVENDIFFPEHCYFEDMPTMPRLMAKAINIKTISDRLYVESRVIMDIFQKEVMLSIKQEKFFRTC